MPLYYDQGNAAAPPALIALILELRFHLFLAHRNCCRRRLHARPPIVAILLPKSKLLKIHLSPSQTNRCAAAAMQRQLNYKLSANFFDNEMYVV